MEMPALNNLQHLFFLLPLCNVSQYWLVGKYGKVLETVSLQTERPGSCFTISQELFISYLSILQYQLLNGNAGLPGVGEILLQ